MKPYTRLLVRAKQCVLLIGLGVFSSVVFAETTPIPVYEIHSSDTFIQAPIDHEIYHYSRDAQLNDVQVLDAQSNKLPFRIINVGSESQVVHRETPAIFFPVAANTSEETLRTLSSTSIQINSDKVQVEITESSANPSIITDNPDFYLIDLTAFQKKSAKESGLQLTGLRLALKDNQAPYQTWALSASNDLHQWHLLSTTTLVQLHKEGHSLVQDQIALNLNYHDYAYLQLRCTENCISLSLSTITILENSTTQFFPADTDWKLKGQSASQKAIKLNANDTWQSAAAWEFNRDDVAPIEKFSLALGTHVYGDKIRLLGRAQSKDAWQLLYQGIWFNTKVGNQWYASNAQSFYGNHHEFRLEFASSIQTNPELIFYTQAKMVQFVGNQLPPYQLVISHADAGQSQSQSRILDAVLNNQSPDWVNHQWTFLNTPKPEFITQISWRSWIFWGLIILAVTLLALMTMKLFKQMNIKAE